MPTLDELLPLVTNILDRVEADRSALDGWRQTEDGQKVIQYVVQIGKYNTNLGEGKDISIGDRLDRALLEEVRDLLRSELSSQAVEINWPQVSRLLLEQQVQRLTSNPLTHAEGIAYQTDQVYVPLGLVERKRQSRRGEDVSPEQGSQLYEETEITQQFEYEEFLEQVLGQGDSPRSGGRRLAIIGEPGAGKTTLLQRTAQWISRTIDDSIVIWISLADLQGESLEKYLLGPWLQAAVQQQGKVEASPQIKDAFVAQFQQGKVWLLLDGADEMQVSSGNPLSEIERQVRGGGLLSQARIVLTCRLNLWDSNRNALDTFDTYRTLEFSYPEQVEQFVGQWFGALPEGQELQAERLCAVLKTPGKERIRDLVKNPLRLTLLCFNWYLGEGTLPETKADLYEQFVADFYEWKREQFPTMAAQQRQLNTALGELAREAIDSKKAPFRLHHEFICEFLGDLDESNSLFQLAIRLGWLNCVGLEIGSPRKSVYAFFHPTFQEYFSTLVINDWRFFLNHIPENPNDSNTSYRIFERQWKEVILLWLGRQNIQPQQKNDFLETLVLFKDLCGSENFYGYRAYLLAALGTAEYKNSPLKERILSQVIQWAAEGYEWSEYRFFSTKDIQEHLIEDRKYNKELGFVVTNPQLLAFQTLMEMDYSSTIEKISQTKNQCSISTLWNLIEILEKIGKGSITAIRALIHIIQFPETEDIRRDDDEYLRNRFTHYLEDEHASLMHKERIVEVEKIRQRASEALVEIGKKNIDAINILVELIQNTKENFIRYSAAEILDEVDFGNELASDILTQQIKYTDADSERLYILENYDEMYREFCHSVRDYTDIEANYDHFCVSLPRYERWRENTIDSLPLDIEELTKVMNSSDTYCEAWIAAQKLLQVDSGNKNAIEMLKNLRVQDDEAIQWLAIENLLQIFPNDSDLIINLINLGEAQLDEIYPELKPRILKALKKCDLASIVKAFSKYISGDYRMRGFSHLEFLWHCAQNMSYQDFYNAYNDQY